MLRGPVLGPTVLGPTVLGPTVLGPTVPTGRVWLVPRTVRTVSGGRRNMPSSRRPDRYAYSVAVAGGGLRSSVSARSWRPRQG
jgi:hypothetical protein